MFNRFISKRNYVQLTSCATKAAIFVACSLCILKFFVWQYTGSNTIKISLLDSMFDVVISAINFVIVSRIVIRKTNKFLHNFDKISAISTLIQACLMLYTVVYAIFTSLALETPVVSILSIVILFVSFILSVILLIFQRKVYKVTGSLIIKADMLHYQTDLITNFVGMVFLCISWIFDIGFLDFMAAIIMGCYLLKMILWLAIDAMKVLLDYKKSNVKYLKYLKDNDCDISNISNISVVSSGIKDCVIISYKNTIDILQIKELIKEIDQLAIVWFKVDI